MVADLRHVVFSLICLQKQKFRTHEWTFVVSLRFAFLEFSRRKSEHTTEELTDVSMRIYNRDATMRKCNNAKKRKCTNVTMQKCNNAKKTTMLNITKSENAKVILCCPFVLSHFCN
jgi:hypothetical protein